MAGGFSFPPPPPPPQRAAAPLRPDSGYGSQQRGRGGGRGNSNNRGRGDSTPGVATALAPQVEGSNFIPLGVRGRGRGFGNGPPSRGNAAAAGHGSSHANYSSSGSAQQMSTPGPNSSTSFTALPSGAHVNPRFLNGTRIPNALVNSGHGKGQNSTDARHNGYVGSESPPFGSLGTITSHPDRSHAGHKRKLDALRGDLPPREKLPAVPTMPAVPSFSAAPSLGRPSMSSAPSTSARHRTAARTPQMASSSLGLIPRDNDDYDELVESDDEDAEDVDEEALYAELGTRLTFEHNGEVMSLNNAADLAAWREARRKAFPTSTRVADREDDLRRTGEERRRLLADANLLWREVPLVGRKARATVAEARKVAEVAEVPIGQPETKLQQATRRLAECAETLETVRKSSTKSQEEHQQLLDLYGLEGDQSRQSPPAELLTTMGDIEQDAASKPASQDAGRDHRSDSAAESASSSEVSSNSSSSESDTDEDEPPETSSSKPQVKSGSTMGLCRYYSASGYCRDGDACRFRHELSAKANAAFRAASQVARPAVDRFAPKLDKPTSNSRKSIHERLVEQEQEEEDRLMLKAIKALGQAGFFAVSNNPA